MIERPADSSVFEALAKESRRKLLFALWAENPNDHDRFDPLTLLEVGKPPDDDVTEIALHHHHLPKLADIGVLRWEPESGKISTGPQWDDIALLLELLDDHRTELPDELVEPDSP